MNHRLEIASRLLAARYAQVSVFSTNDFADVISATDWLIRECGEECPTRSVSSEHIGAMEYQLKREIQARLKAEDEYYRLRSECQKLVDNWNEYGWNYAAKELESVLKGGAK